jgi:hypothetical protein
MEAFDDSIADADFGAFPHELPPAEPAGKGKGKGKGKARAAVTQEHIAMVDDLANESKHRQELQRKIELVRRAQRYHERFGNRISSKLPPKFGVKMNLDQIEEVVANIERDLGSGMSRDMLAAIYQEMFVVAENVTERWNPLKVAWRGPRVFLSQVVEQQRPNWLPIIDELAILWEPHLSTGPEKRLLWVTIQMMLVAHAANKQPLPEDPVNKPASEETAKVAQDLFGAQQPVVPDGLPRVG